LRAFGKSAWELQENITTFIDGEYLLTGLPHQRRKGSPSVTGTKQDKGLPVEKPAKLA
jgi:hypothetical protein